MIHARSVGRAALFAAIAVFSAACLTTPASAARQAQQMNDLSDAINDARTENATLAQTVDSLRAAVAKQDSTIARLANAAGIQIPK